MLMNST